MTFTSKQLHRRLQIGSVRLQLAAERDSTFEFSARDLNKFDHFSSEMYLMKEEYKKSSCPRCT